MPSNPFGLASSSSPGRRHTPTNNLAASPHQLGHQPAPSLQRHSSEEWLQVPGPDGGHWKLKSKRGGPSVAFTVKLGSVLTTLMAVRVVMTTVGTLARMFQELPLP